MTRALSLLPLACLLSTRIAAVAAHVHDDDQGLSKFVTRPDIRAPRWKVNITRPDLVTPGYWFVAPFEHIDEHEPGNGWIGPTIYDGNGDLIWSGVNINQNWDVLDFRVSNVRGKPAATFMVQREGTGYIMDNSYRIQEKVKIGRFGVDYNSHEFNFRDNGTRVVVIAETHANATREDIQSVDYDRNCRILFGGFKEMETETWKPVFKWNSFGHIPLSYSTYADSSLSARCNDHFGWDYVHLNSIDKDQNGDYLLSSRHTDRIYKISRLDGHVMWSLPGQPGRNVLTIDDKWQQHGVRFSRQHHLRFRGFNGTHEIISMLDNAKGQDKQKPTSLSSRALVIALDVVNRVATLETEILHPYGPGHWAFRRGSHQFLDNKHTFVGWSEQGTHSEHDAEGNVLMTASLLSEWLGTYRSYKFPWVGSPPYPPVAHSVGYPSKARNSTTTLVHVSWNGATEVDHYKLFKTTESGKPKVQIFEKKRAGFETAMAWDGFAKYIIVDAFDKKGVLLGSTGTVQTLDLPVESMTKDVADEMYWQQEVKGENEGWKDTPYAPYYPSHSTGWTRLILGGCLLFVVVGAFVWHFTGRGSALSHIGSSKQKYWALVGQEHDEEDMDCHMDQVAPSARRDLDGHDPSDSR